MTVCIGSFVDFIGRNINSTAPRLVLVSPGTDLQWSLTSVTLGMRMSADDEAESNSRCENMRTNTDDGKEESEVGHFCGRPF